jgi:acetylornithine deacetylase/succinyl-diaminopimelate desuccinylase-like protein
MRLPSLVPAILLATVASPLFAQQPASSSAFTPDVAQRPAVKDALARIDAGFGAHVQEWIRLTEMPAKSEHEQQRAAYVKAQLEQAGYTATIDSIGNVTARRRGTGGGPVVVFAAHMDTVHPMDADLTVHRDSSSGKLVLRAPGIFDNTASVANLLAVARAMQQAHVQTRGDVVFVFTVQEELGLVGMNYWLAHNPRPDLVVAMDGGLGPIDYGALGIYWTRYHFTGEGSHTNTSTGKPHPARALAQAITSIYELRVPPNEGGAVYNVGMLSGGSVFNAIPQDVSFTMDLRSVNPRLLDSLDNEITARVARAAADQHVQWHKEIVQHLDAGGTEEMLRDRRHGTIVETAVAVHHFLGIDLGPREAEATGSTDANVAVTRGIPAISVGRSVGGNQHTLAEWSDVQSALPATKMVLLLAVSLAGQGLTP